MRCLPCPTYVLPSVAISCKHGRVSWPISCPGSWTSRRRESFLRRCTSTLGLPLPQTDILTNAPRASAQILSRSEAKSHKKGKTSARRIGISGQEDDSAGRSAFRPKQSLGQNFLKDREIAGRIADAFARSVDELCPGAGVLEVGAGTGALTKHLVKRYPSMHAIDIDQRAVAYLQEALPALDVSRSDVLQVDWTAIATRLGGPVAVIGNLPYNIVSQILFSLFEAPPGSVRMAVVMMQKEVAERITAAFRTKAYGILSVVGQLYSKPETLFGVPPSAFRPRPSVDSAVVRFEFTPHPCLDVYNTTLTSGLRSVLRSAFQQRRKTMRNSLRNVCEEQNVALPENWASKRAEELTPPEFIDLSKFIFAEKLSTFSATRQELSKPQAVWRPTKDAGVGIDNL